MHNSSYSRPIWCLMALLLTINLSSRMVVCKPTIERSFPQHNFKTIIKSARDLIAMPTNQQQQEHLAEQTPQTIQYITIDSSNQPVQSQNQDHHQQQQQQQPQQQQQQQEVVYYMLPDGSTIEASEYIKQQQQQTQHYHVDSTKPCVHEGSNSKTTKTTTESEQLNAEAPSSEQLASGYPGEIIYTNQAGELLRQVEGPYEPLNGNNANTDDEKNIHSRPSVELVTMAGKSLRESSADLTATILTEIPLNDMSQEVLEQLKKDYGAKVVATREYPGANLVINCADNSGLDVSLCSGNKQAAAAQAQAAYHLSQPEPEREHHHILEHDQHHKQQQPQTQNLNSPDLGHHVVEYTESPLLVTSEPVGYNSPVPKTIALEHHDHHQGHNTDNESEIESADREHELPVLEHEHESEHESEKLVHHPIQPIIEAELNEDYNKEHHDNPTTNTANANVNGPEEQENNHSYGEHHQLNNEQYQNNHESQPHHHHHYQRQQQQAKQHLEENTHQSLAEHQIIAQNNEYQQTTPTTLTTNYATNEHVNNHHEQENHSIQNPRDSSATTTISTTTTTAKSATTSTNPSTLESDQIVPTSSYDVVEVTSSATNRRDQKVPVNSNTKTTNNANNIKQRREINQTRRANRRSDIRDQPDELSSISQEEEKIERSS